MEMSRYLDLFLAESRDHLAAALQIVARMGSAEPVGPQVRELLRHVHSIKGMAATMSYGPMVELSHALEDKLEQLGQADAAQLGRHARLLEDCLTCLDRMVDQVGHGREPETGGVAELVRALHDLSPQRPAVDVGLSQATDPAPSAPSGPSPEILWRIDLELAPGLSRPAERTVAILRRLAELGRLRAADPPLLDASTGRFEGRLRLELASRRSREELEADLAGLVDVRHLAIEKALAAAAHPTVATPAHWIRVQAERVDALVEQVLDLRVELDHLRGEILDPSGRQRLQRSESLVKEIHANTIELRLVPFDSVSPRLQRCASELARELGKQVRLDIEGADVRIDRLILDGLVDPLLHMIRNAVDHGLEPPEERRRLGKAEVGTLRLSIQRLVDRIQLAVEDDGRGLDVTDLRRVAVERGIIPAARADSLTDGEALMLATRPGFSTARTVSRVSGRGVGLDVVRDSVERLGGELRIQSEPCSSTRILIRVPLSLSLIRALLFERGGETFALPVAAIRRVMPLRQRPGRPAADGLDGLELREITEILDLPGSDRGQAEPRLAVLLEGKARTGLAIDRVLGRRDIVVHPFPPPLSRLRGLAGAALLEDGSIALLLDALRL